MNLTTIRKDLDEILFINSNDNNQKKTINKFGTDYTVLGIEPNLIKQISEIVIENMENLDISERVKLITVLVTSQIFEEVWLGYNIWKNSKKSYLGLERAQILALRPKTNGIFNHMYATSILPPYIRIGKFNQNILFQLIDTKNLADQLISLRAFLVISRKSTKFRKLSNLMLENRNWIDNGKITCFLSHINNQKKYSVSLKKTGFQKYELV